MHNEVEILNIREMTKKVFICTRKTLITSDATLYVIFRADSLQMSFMTVKIVHLF